ncbi:MAG: aspartate kinase [Eubacteriales bacterium]|nr:aspartate kinase [Eubacteriales bacterium]
MIVSKFGGTSLANAEQIKKVCTIITANPDRKVIVVSAPGKRFKDDIKVTDLLINLAEGKLSGDDYHTELEKLMKRFEEITSDLSLDESVIDKVRSNITALLNLDTSDGKRFTDSMKSAGEDSSALIVSAYLRKIGYDAHYINPGDAGMLMTKEYGNAEVLPEAYEKLGAYLTNAPGISIFPGFFGYTADGEIVTFSRGGSDITGSILAAAVDAKLYENFTDVDSVYAVNPNIVPNPEPIRMLTYREMRELAYSGFGVFHEDALVPVFRKGVPVAIKNTNNPTVPGTMIVPKIDKPSPPVVGIASATGFCSIYLHKYMMNREIGFGRRLLTILEDEKLSYEHTPSGIDDISVILKQSQLDSKKENRILEKIKNELKVDSVFVERDLALVMVVGEGARNSIGMAERATGAFARAGINILMINQGSSEFSMMFGIKAEEAEKAVKSLYHEFFRD